MGIFETIKKVFTGDEKPDRQEASTPSKPAPLSEETYIAAIEVERAEKDGYFRRDPYGPIEDRTNFSGLSYYPPDPAFRFTLPLQRAEPESLTFQTSTGDERVYQRIGTVEFEVEGQPAQLAIYKSEDYDELFLPFRDATSGVETYGAGRYLEPVELGSGELLVDFNLAYNPYCAYSDAFSCPLPPVENWLTTVPIRAGEKIYKKPESTN
ncbi:MAG: hypothetical protein DPW09_12950 [Anaerolineae bacterium]|nr:DUF1684 domain-containing protein [Anaerolineales bacterium]MCQ3974348.1 hypothetical protein [Anaerolineae bacterium]